MRCIWCGEEIEGSIRDHMAEKHVAVSGAPTPAPVKEPEMQHAITPEISHSIPHETPKDTPTLPMEKPKKRYLDAAEIITLLHNTNKQFPTNQISECPLTKENET